MMAAQIVYRAWGSNDDVAQLTALLHRAYKELADMGLRYTATWQTAAITEERIQGGRCTVAVLNGRFVGTVTFYRESDGCEWYERPDVASFGQFGVDPDFRGQGIGRTLLDIVEAQARESGAEELALDTAEGATHLISLYLKRGFRFVQHVQWHETNYRSVILSKRLTG